MPHPTERQQPEMEPFSFASSTSLKEQVSVRIDRLDGTQKVMPFSELLRRPDLKHQPSNLNPHSELYVTAQLWADSKPLAVPVQTAYKSFNKGRIWNQWLTLPVQYLNIPLSAQLAITVWDLSPTAQDSKHAVPFGGTTVPLFDEDNTLQKGRQRCRIHRHKAADGLSDTTTPWVIRPGRKSREEAKPPPEPVNEHVAEMERLEGLLKRMEMEEIPQVSWLDDMLYKKMMKLRSEALKAESRSSTTLAKTRTLDDGEVDGKLDEGDEDLFYLHIEFPRFDHPIVFTDIEYEPPPISNIQHSPGSEIRLKPPPEVSFGPGINIDGNGYGDADAGRLIRIYDPEVGARDNIVEVKHRRLVRSHTNGMMDKEMKPNARIRDELNAIMSYGPLHELAPEEKDLIWKFRYNLTRDKRALTKFVKSVTWSEPVEARQASQLIDKWVEIDVDDALELLGPQVTNAKVRAYAVDRLRKAADDELMVYLLQLVQALKFEAIPPEQPTEDGAEDSSLARFLITRAKDSFLLGNFFYWYLMVECDDHSPDQTDQHRTLYSRVAWLFMHALDQTPEGVKTRDTLRRQAELIVILSRLSKEIRLAREDRTRKITRLKKFLADPKNDLMNMEPLPLPLDPSIHVTGIYPDEAGVLKSSLFPLLLHFRTSNNTKYSIMFKTGDDLRQDQLVIQTIQLIERLLGQDGLDLKLSPYSILATGPLAGAVQFVPSTSLAAAISKHKTLLAYLRANNPDEHADLGVRKQAMDTYIKSCAGYCVITYLLGVGDRHLDNLLIRPSGHFFHVDFGYILGRDPKPFAPLMKLSSEMIEGFGGPQHPNFSKFKSYAFTAFTALRKSSNLILNLFALMREANIPDIKFERDKAVWKVQERFMLEMGEGEAVRGFERLMEDSLGAVMPVVIDRLHGLVQHWRA